MKRFIIVLFCFFSVQSLFAQDEISIGKTREVVVSRLDSVLRFEVLTKSTGISPDMAKTYYWYSQNRIYSNQGDFYGKLLHGTYCLFDSERRLIVKGDFKEGLKVGNWFRWHLNGKIAVHEQWKDGLLKGKVITYSDKGDVQSLEKFKNDVKHGTQFYYSEGGLPVKEVQYKNGAKHGKEIIHAGQKPLILKYKNGVLLSKAARKKDRVKLFKPSEQNINKGNDKEGYLRKRFSSKKEKTSVQKGDKKPAKE